MAKTNVVSFTHCMRLMRQHDPQLREHGFHTLLPRASEFVPELREFGTEGDLGLRCWLLELLGQARDERAIATFTRQLDSSSESLRSWAVTGLRLLDTKESRRILFEAGLNAGGDPTSDPGKSPFA